MKRNLRFAGLLAGVVIVAAACSSGAATTAPSAEAPSAAPSVEASAAPSAAPSAATLSGELTLWESYASGGGELGGFNKIIDGIKAANPDLKINVVEQPFSDIFNKWNTDVAAGGGPDMFIAPNDNLFSQADAGVLADVTSALSGKLDGFTPVSVEGSKVGDKLFMVPESLKAVALWYDKSAVATAPATTDDLLAAVKDGSVKLGLNQNAYHMFGFSGSFGGKLMDDSGKCVADQAGFADAFKYFQTLKAAGAKYYTDGNALKQDFQTGKLNAVIDGPWQTADFKTALGDKLAVAKMPAGASGSKADPFTGTDGWYINPNGKNIDLAVAFALDFVGTPNEQIFSDEGGHVPAAPGVTISDPLVQGFADAAADGLARPQSSQFNNYWGPFGDAVNQVLDKNADATTTVTNACKLMNEANGL
jgi:arabinogalactan oligomer / maltooligosaccharide transport system substrate-binding protein